MKDATGQLRSATRRAKSDVANKLISMFLHELSRKICREWEVRIEGADYGALVRAHFGNRCPYCLRDLESAVPVIEHLDGMNRYRAGLHVPGNVLVSCKKCNGEKRRDDSLRELVLADTGWASFLSHDGSRCPASCGTCRYWTTVWEDPVERSLRLSQNIERIRSFREKFPKLEESRVSLGSKLQEALVKLYVDCQLFAESEIASLLDQF